MNGSLERLGAFPQAPVEGVEAPAICCSAALAQCRSPAWHNRSRWRRAPTRVRLTASTTKNFGPSSSARSASSTATSARARSTRSAKPSRGAKAASFAGREAVFGVLSLIIWALLLIVTLKYVLHPAARRQQGRRRHVRARWRSASPSPSARPLSSWALGIAGASFFYGDAVITPAISVLSAVEGLKLVSPAFEQFVIPLSVVILVGLFAMQSRGTDACRQVLRPDHRRVVHRARRRRAHSHRRQPGRAGRAQPLLRRALRLQARARSA